jgi:hypothetical protein
LVGGLDSLFLTNTYMTKDYQEVEDLIKRLNGKAAAIEMGEKIDWGSDSAIMREAAKALASYGNARELQGVEQGVEIERNQKHRITVIDGHTLTVDDQTRYYGLKRSIKPKIYEYEITLPEVKSELK